MKEVSLRTFHLSLFKDRSSLTSVVRVSVVVIVAVFVLWAALGTHTQKAHAQAYGGVSPSVVVSAKGNVFPYPACTWWANERYHQLHHIYVPWTTNAMAWQWTDRAHDFHWHVSTRPAVGTILDLQPWVQGAYGGGHVAVVERVLRNGHVIASSMSWGANPYAVTDWEFAPGPGVTFISR